ncbi:MAG: vWA domain-containing protein, partial [Polyangiaceae bacterium]
TVSDPAEAAQRERVAAWARRTGADLHAIRCQFELNDGRTDPSNAAVVRPDRGDPLDLAPGFFRDGSYVAASSNSALAEAVDKALTRAASAQGAVDIALVVDRTGRMGASLETLRGMRSTFEGFVASPDRRLAIVGWGEGPAVVSMPFGRSPESIDRAFRGLRPVPSNDQGKDLLGALDVARRLGWRPDAQKSLVVMTATTWHWGRPFAPVEDWTDEAHVALTFVEPPPD